MGKPQSKKLWFILGAIITTIIIIGGLTMFKIRTDEERRNHEYEVSLVKALKNSYAGIEEIKITDPNYTNPPGSWTCNIELKFNDKKLSKYRINYSLHYQRISDISLERENRIKDREYLNKNKGETLKKIKVIYSDGEKGEQ